ncbi:MAG: chemotaxis protein CheA [Thermoleophilia bacterium]|nr:chemotaxis protein CheA [Thermoleophilia bacterium]
MDMQEYLGLFLDESRENLQALNASILDLEREPDDPIEALNTIFRVAHSLKGMSATMGFERMAGLTHRMEEVLSKLRDGHAPVTTDVTDVLFACLDTLEGMVNDIGDGGDGAADTTPLMGRLAAILSGEALAGAQAAATAAPPAEAPAAPAPAAAPVEAADAEAVAEGISEYEAMVIAEAAERGMTVRRLHVTLEENCMLRAARAYMVVQELETIGEIIKSEPSTEDLEREAFDHEFTIWLASERDDADIVAAVTGVSEVAACAVNAVEAPAAVGDPDPAPAVAEVPVAEAPEPAAEAPAPVAEEAPKAEAKPAPPAADGGAKKAKAAQTVRVGTDRLDSLMNLMGEMVIHRTRLWQLSSDHDLADLRGAVEEMTRVTNDLQSLIMQVRMMPVEAVFMRFPRMVRDLANSLGKQLELIITGEDTELDRTVIDELGDPLVHMLRNAVDHGLEGPEERVAAGKDPVGIVRLTARHEGNSVVIEVSEDGRGLDPDGLRNAVVKKGLMTRAEVDSLSDREAQELIFLAGFSTAAVTTDVSGRGVGMDAVRAKINGLNGSVEIHSELGKGSRFVIRLPLTLAIIQALLVKGAGEVYALPLEAIEETVVIDRTETRPVDGVECMVLRDHIVPLVSLRERLGLYGMEEEGDKHSVVVVKSGTARLGVVVDELVGQQDVVIKHLPEYLGDVRGVAGATILGDGSVALIVDVGALGDRRGVAA